MIVAELEGLLRPDRRLFDLDLSWSNQSGRGARLKNLHSTLFWPNLEVVEAELETLQLSFFMAEV